MKFGCSFNSQSVFGLMDACVFAWITSSVPVVVLEQCLCICLRALCVCKCACEYAGLWRKPLSVWNAVGWISPVSATREGVHWRATDSFWPRKGSNIFSLSVGGNKPMAGKTTTDDQLHPLFFAIPFHFPEQSLTLSDLIPTMFALFQRNRKHLYRLFLREKDFFHYLLCFQFSPG